MFSTEMSLLIQSPLLTHRHCTLWSQQPSKERKNLLTISILFDLESEHSLSKVTQVNTVKLGPEPWAASRSFSDPTFYTFLWIISSRHLAVFLLGIYLASSRLLPEGGMHFWCVFLPPSTLGVYLNESWGRRKIGGCLPGMFPSVVSWKQRMINSQGCPFPLVQQGVVIHLPSTREGQPLPWFQWRERLWPAVLHPKCDRAIQVLFNFSMALFVKASCQLCQKGKKEKCHKTSFRKERKKDLLYTLALMLITPPFKSQLNRSPSKAWEIHGASAKVQAPSFPMLHFSGFLTPLVKTDKQKNEQFNLKLLSPPAENPPHSSSKSSKDFSSHGALVTVLLRAPSSTGTENLVSSQSGSLGQVTSSKPILEKYFP